MEDSFLKALAEGGYQVEALAGCYFSEGIFETTEKNQSNHKAIKCLLGNEAITLFEQVPESLLTCFISGSR
ncbi:hypothetical protein Lmor_1223 [Legionella moravica]|uniref:Uncharacterized protein n=1 Tax=Legionella moravica TaxID=39962 RepID=A0A378JS57_9GAMM|nr:hypothetical protein [Legionella sp. km535]KTD34690.1 hypothetical protein Lmor_1223 [Legionella moravica]STX61296.1 Uncharacterised protein [Legionella moravica]